MTDYSALKQQFQAANRKTGGSLAVKDLSSIVPREKVVDTENLMTIVVTVPQYAHKDFLSSYETWCEMVVPRSAIEVARDGEYILMRVIIFRRMLDDFKSAARMKSCQVSGLPPPPPAAQQSHACSSTCSALPTTQCPHCAPAGSTPFSGPHPSLWSVADA